MRALVALLALLSAGAATLATAASAEPLRIEGGQIADAALDSSGIRVFKGIPFAAPPLGDLRWKAPQPVKSWDGVRSTDEWGARCIQTSRLGDIDPFNRRMSED